MKVPLVRLYTQLAKQITPASDSRRLVRHDITKAPRHSPSPRYDKRACGARDDSLPVRSKMFFRYRAGSSWEESLGLSPRQRITASNTTARNGNPQSMDQ